MGRISWRNIGIATYPVSVGDSNVCDCSPKNQIADPSLQKMIQSFGDLVVLGLRADTNWLQLPASLVLQRYLKTLFGFGGRKIPSP
jgi:hypothetical protein